MTAQTNDSIIYGDKEYKISAIENVNEFFDIHSLGLMPEGKCTSCWRGYIAVFSIDKNNQLILNKLYANNGDLPAPVINGKTPHIVDFESLLSSKDFDYRHSAGNLFYDNVNIPINYSGALLVTDGFIRDRYVHMGFQSPWSYNEVLELTFSGGQFLSAKDQSLLAAEMRKTTPEVEKWDNILKWIDDSFDLSYSKKW